MIKDEFVRRTAAASGQSQPTVRAVLNAALGVVGDVAASGDKVVLPGFGTFLVRQRPEALRRNPGSGQPVLVPAGQTVHFKASAKLRAKVDGGYRPDAAPAPEPEPQA